MHCLIGIILESIDIYLLIVSIEHLVLGGIKRLGEYILRADHAGSFFNDPGQHYCLSKRGKTKWDASYRYIYQVLPRADMPHYVFSVKRKGLDYCRRGVRVQMVRK